MKITLKDGSVKEYEHSMSVIDIAKDLSEGLARVATSGRVNGELVDLRTVVDSDSEVEILTFDNEEGKGAFCPYNISYHGSGNQETLSGDKTCDRTFHRKWILL